jgi:hypothetical protein
MACGWIFELENLIAGPEATQSQDVLKYLQKGRQHLELEEIVGGGAGDVIPGPAAINLLL